MYYLSATTQKIRVVLAAAVVDSELDCVVSYGRKTDDYNGKSFTSQTNGITPVNASDSPTSGQIIEVNGIDITNLDSAAATVEVQFYDSAATPTSIVIHTATINPGDKLEYNHHGGWKVSDSGGVVKVGNTISTGRTTRNWTTELIPENIAEDLDGETIQSSSYEAFRCTKVVPIDVIYVTCTRDTFDVIMDRDEFLQKVNSEVYEISGKSYDIGQLIVWDLKVLEYEELGTIKYRFEYTFKGRTDMADPWQFRPIDEGFYTYNFTTDQWVEVTTNAGTPVARPVLLDGAGAELDVETGVPVRLTYRRYDSADFNHIVFP